MLSARGSAPRSRSHLGSNATCPSTVSPSTLAPAPAEAPIAVVRGRHRYRLLVKAPREFNLSAYLRDWMGIAPKTRGGIKMDVDVDPMSFY